MPRSSGSAWIEPKKGTPCRVCWRKNGKKQTPSQWFKRRKHAIALRDALTKKLKAERHILPAGQVLPLDEVCDRWIAARKAAGAMGDGTAVEADREVKRILRLTEWKTVASITPRSLQDFRGKYPKNARGSAMRYLRAMLRWCALSDTLAQPVPSGLDLSVPQTMPSDRPLASDEQIDALVAKTKADGTWPLIHVAATYPWRPKSLSLLQVKHVDLRNPESASLLLKKTKNGKDVRGYLMPVSVPILRPLVKDRGPEEFVFLQPAGMPWPLDKKGSANAMSKWFTRTLGSAGLQLYDLKRRAMTDLSLASQGDIASVAAVAGVSKQTALRYMQTNENRIRELLKRRAALGGNSGATK